MGEEGKKMERRKQKTTYHYTPEKGNLKEMPLCSGTQKRLSKGAKNTEK